MRVVEAINLTCSNCGDGNDTATLVAAITSVLVALATFWVAFTTRSAARAAESSATATVRSAGATEGLLEAQLASRLIDVQPLPAAPPDPERPHFGESYELTDVRVGEVVIEGPEDGRPEEIAALGSVPVRNVGPGLAQIVGVALDPPDSWLSGKPPEGFRPNWRSSKRFVPSGETARVSFWFPKPEYQHDSSALEDFATRVSNGDYLLVRVIYARRPESGRELHTTFVIFPEGAGWRVGDCEFSDLS